jgi:hypothetical protein
MMSSEICGEFRRDLGWFYLRMGGGTIRDVTNIFCGVGSKGGKSSVAAATQRPRSRAHLRDAPPPLKNKVKRPRAPLPDGIRRRMGALASRKLFVGGLRDSFPNGLDVSILKC